MKCFVHIVFSLGLILIGATSWADELIFTATVDKAHIGMQDRILLTIDISAAHPAMIQKIDLPDTGTLSVMNTQRNTRNFQSDQGTTTRQIINILLTPTRPGKTSISSAHLIYKGKTFSTQPIEIEVDQDPTSTSPTPSDTLPGRAKNESSRKNADQLSSEPTQKYPQKSSREGIFITLHVTPDTLLEGQQLTATLAVYANLRARIREIRWPRLKGFYSVARDVNAIKTENRFIDNIPYQYKVLDRKALFPLETGQLALDPIEVDIEMLTLPSMQTQQRTLRTKPVQVTVKELPIDKRPRSFHRANVGIYKIATSVDTNEAALNEQITYTIKIEGNGNIQLVRPPELPQLPRFKVFDPTIKVSTNKHSFFVRGSKTFKYNMVPISSGELIIPSLVFSYYDLEQQAYHSITSEPQTIRVKAAGTDYFDNQMIEGHQVNIVATGFETAIPYDTKLEDFTIPFYQHSLFWPALLLPPIVYLLFLLAGYINTYVHKDNQRNRMKKAWSRKQKRIKRSAKLINTQQPNAFYAELKIAILDGIEASTGISPQGLTLDELQIAMRKKGVHATSIETTIQEIENCDYGRFAPTQSREDELRAALKRTKRLLKLLEK